MNNKVIRFEDLIAWQKAQDLTVKVYETFGKISDFAFRNQIRSAAISVSNNISEGFGSNSKKEFVRYPGIAKNSCNEVKSMCYLGQRLSYIDQAKKEEMIMFCEEVSKIISGLIRSVLNQIK
ncbi:MAG: four helix bundle protein [Chitinophagaceae bacterium]|nr:four helix bundle protein [Chitinophagaceae bacterium]MCW5926098.1 four helix bundle protein [Chitinophagaceae bacterium]